MGYNLGHSLKPCSTQLCMKFLISVLLFTSPGNKQQITDKSFIFLLSLAESIIFSAYEYGNAKYSLHFHIYQQRKFHAQVS